ncbi:hypothetical protein E8P77_21495 [Soehngenia saccharolytica]|nr:hypothetical protein E8P77_21495 [Soehngenia saccharolytica]
MSDKLKSKEIKKYFGDKPFSNNDLYNFYLNYEPDLKKSTFGWRVHNLKQRGLIYSLKKGVYTTKDKKDFKPIIDSKLINLYNNVKEKFPYLLMAVWETSWLNNYMVHQAFSNSIILEVEKDAASAVFSFLQESYRDIYLNPDRFVVENYIITGQDSIVIKNITLTSPLIEREDVIVPTIEKILVDIYTDDEFFVSYQGGELENIFKEFFTSFKINQSTLRQYANKRHVRDRLITFLVEDAKIDKDKILI